MGGRRQDNMLRLRGRAGGGVLQLISLIEAAVVTLVLIEDDEREN